MNQGTSGWRVLGKIHIYSINHSGQGLRLCSPENTFVLSQKPSIFHLLVMTSSSMKFDWVCSMLVVIRLVCESKFLAHHKDGTTSAVPVSHGHLPDYSVDLEFHKCVFDHVGSSFKSRVLEDGWMRHENSRVYV